MSQKQRQMTFDEWQMCVDLTCTALDKNVPASPTAFFSLSMLRCVCVSKSLLFYLRFRRIRMTVSKEQNGNQRKSPFFHHLFFLPAEQPKFLPFFAFLWLASFKVLSFSLNLLTSSFGTCDMNVSLSLSPTCLLYTSDAADE